MHYSTNSQPKYFLIIGMGGFVFLLGLVIRRKFKVHLIVQNFQLPCARRDVAVLKRAWCEICWAVIFVIDCFAIVSLVRKYSRYCTNAFSELGWDYFAPFCFSTALTTQPHPRPVFLLLPDQSMIWFVMVIGSLVLYPRLTYKKVSITFVSATMLCIVSCLAPEVGIRLFSNMGWDLFFTSILSVSRNNWTTRRFPISWYGCAQNSRVYSLSCCSMIGNTFLFWGGGWGSSSVILAPTEILFLWLRLGRKKRKKKKYRHGKRSGRQKGRRRKGATRSDSMVFTTCHNIVDLAPDGWKCSIESHFPFDLFWWGSRCSPVGLGKSQVGVIWVHKTCKGVTLVDSNFVLLRPST